MNNEFDSQRDEAMLDALLKDESWPELDAATKGVALAEFRAGQRRRRARMVFAQAAAVAILAGGVMWWSNPVPEAKIAQVSVKNISPTPTNSPVTVTAVPLARPEPSSVAKETGPHYISEAEMLALFPKGSCAIAEIDGKKELIFLDPKIERDGAPYHPGS